MKIYQMFRNGVAGKAFSAHVPNCKLNETLFTPHYPCNFYRCTKERVFLLILGRSDLRGKRIRSNTLSLVCVSEVKNI
jgi:hypothetical protein